MKALIEMPSSSTHAPIKGEGEKPAGHRPMRLAAAAPKWC